MNLNLFRIAIVLLVAPAMMACSSSGEMVQPQRRAISSSEAVLSKKLQASQQELETLREALQREQAENKRFREMMNTNFELLERSVASSLQQSIAQQTPPVQTVASASPPVEPLASNNIALTEADQPSRAMPTENAIGQNSSAEDALGVPSDGSMATAGHLTIEESLGLVEEVPQASTVIIADAELEEFNDPDLIPPQDPIILSIHREAKSLYDKGFIMMSRKEYQNSIDIYTNFLKNFPDDQYSDNARFWIGEAHLAMGNIDAAENEYRELLRQYEHRSSLEGFKTPEAIYRLGQIYAMRGDNKRASYYFDEVSQRFPSSTAGKRATAELEL